MFYGNPQNIILLNISHLHEEIIGKNNFGTSFIFFLF